MRVFNCFDLQKALWYHFIIISNSVRKMFFITQRITVLKAARYTRYHTVYKEDLSRMMSLRNTIAHVLEHQDYLEQSNEATAQQYVVLPILRALGWNDSDLSSREVLPEHPVERYRVDYALTVGQVPSVFIECKKWNAQLTRHEEQICFYAYSAGVPIAIITNGKVWRFYLSQAQAPSLSDRIFCETDIANPESASTLEAYLSKSNVESGDAVRNAKIALENPQSYRTRQCKTVAANIVRIRAFSFESDANPPAWKEVYHRIGITVQQMNRIAKDSEYILAIREAVIAAAEEGKLLHWQGGDSLQACLKFVFKLEPKAAADIVKAVERSGNRSNK